MSLECKSKTLKSTSEILKIAIYTYIYIYTIKCMFKLLLKYSCAASSDNSPTLSNNLGINDTLKFNSLIADIRIWIFSCLIVIQFRAINLSENNFLSCFKLLVVFVIMKEYHWDMGRKMHHDSSNFISLLSSKW